MPRLKLTTKEIIIQFKNRHGDRYDYSKVVYVSNFTKVIIICKDHGEFTQRPSDHKKRGGCPKCAGKHHYNTEEAIRKFIECHGDRYIYDKVVYRYAKENVIITCSTHGDFLQTPNNHWNGSNCPSCVGQFQPSTEELIIEFKKIHGLFYNYDKVVYVSNTITVIIGCPIHGDLFQTPKMHKRTKTPQGCPSCAKTGFNPLVPAILYYVVYEIGRELIYKIGITNRTIKERLGCQDEYIILNSVDYPMGIDAYKTEQHILNVFSRYNSTLIYGDMKYLQRGGETECHYIDILGMDGFNCNNMTPLQLNDIIISRQQVLI